jgi:hypothetical protein
MDDFRWIASFFGINPKNQHVELLNLSRIASCDKADSLSEIALFDAVFEDYINESDEEDEEVTEGIQGAVRLSSQQATGAV